MNMITVRLDCDSTKPLYEQLYEYIKAEIISGALTYNAKLPSKRRLSADLQCSMNTVQNAYSQLAAEGYITARPKSGFFVCQLDGVISIKNKAVSIEANTISAPVYRYDFSYHGVDLDSFPFATWRKINREVINEYDLDLLRLGHSQGFPQLRSGIADYLYHSRSVKCSPNQVVVSSGTEFLMQLLIQLFGEGCTFALENPGYEKLNLIFKSNRTDYRSIALDENGMIPEELQKSGADIACITPSHQFPTGNIMPVSRRIQLLNWANAKNNRYIIEDDYDSEFRYSGKPIPSLQGMDTEGKVIYIGAFSKSLTPAIRISYMVLPEQLLLKYNEKLNFYICPVPSIEQKVLYRFIAEGHFERHLNKMRNIYKKKRETIVTAIRQFLPDSEIAGASAGLHLTLRVKNGMSEAELIKAAQNHGIKVYGFSQFYSGDMPQGMPPSLLLGFANLKAEDIFKVVDLLRKAWF